MTNKRDKINKLAYPLNILYFYLTKGCNLYCRHCWIAPEFQTKEKEYPFLPSSLFAEIIEQAIPLGLSGVKLTGGEPLLNPEIKQILEIIRLKELSCTVETNGVLCTPELASLIASCKEPFVSVSLDGADAKTHEWVRRVTGCFDKAIEGIKNLIAVGIKPQIIMTVMRHNSEQFQAMVSLAESLGADSVKFNILQPVVRGESMHQSGEALTIQELVEIGRYVERELTAKTEIDIFFDHPIAFRPLKKIFRENANSSDTCGILGILGILSDGSFALCGIGENMPELVFGNVKTDSLSHVWNNNPILLKIREGLPEHLEGICKRCLMKHICLGNCLAQNYYTAKNLFAPYYYCNEAFKAGLFPESRLMPLQHSLAAGGGLQPAP